MIDKILLKILIGIQNGDFNLSAAELSHLKALSLTERHQILYVIRSSCQPKAGQEIMRRLYSAGLILHLLPWNDTQGGKPLDYPFPGPTATQTFTSALHLAIERRRPDADEKTFSELLATIIKDGVPVDIRNSNYFTALDIAIQNNDEMAVNVLIKLKAIAGVLLNFNENVPNAIKIFTRLHYACNEEINCQNENILKALIKSDPNIVNASFSGPAGPRTALHEAIGNHNLIAARIILAQENLNLELVPGTQSIVDTLNVEFAAGSPAAWKETQQAIKLALETHFARYLRRLYDVIGNTVTPGTDRSLSNLILGYAVSAETFSDTIGGKPFVTDIIERAIKSISTERKSVSPALSMPTVKVENDEKDEKDNKEAQETAAAPLPAKAATSASSSSASPAAKPLLTQYQNTAQKKGAAPDSRKRRRKKKR